MSRPKNKAQLKRKKEESPLPFLFSVVLFASAALLIWETNHPVESVRVLRIDAARSGSVPTNSVPENSDRSKDGGSRSITSQDSSLPVLSTSPYTKSERYRDELASQLNSQRLHSYYLNKKIESGAVVSPSQPDRILNGSNLDSYRVKNGNGEPVLRPTPDFYPDQEILNALRQQKSEAEQKRQAEMANARQADLQHQEEQQYIDEFIENARRDGVEVSVDQNFNVKTRSINSVGESEPMKSNRGTAR